jgi:hypothetical protein
MRFFITSSLFILTLSTQAFAMKVVVIRQNGEVSVNSKIAINNQAMDLNEGDSIKAVGPKSFVQVKLEHGEVILIKNGEFIVKGDQNIKTNSTIIQLLRGKMFIHVDKKNKDKRKFILHTKSATMGVRGTKFFVTEDNKQSYLCVCEGSVSIQNKSLTRLITKGQDVFATPTGNLKVHKASKVMWKVATEAFTEMKKYK